MKAEFKTVDEYMRVMSTPQGWVMYVKVGIVYIPDPDHILEWDFLEDEEED